MKIKPPYSNSTYPSASFFSTTTLSKCNTTIPQLTTTECSRRRSWYLTDLGQLREALQNLDVFEWARQQRPNSKWVVVDITNATFYVTKLRDHPIGRSVRLPKYVLENRAIVSLDCDKNTGLPYEDKLCFFRRLALHKGCHPYHFYEQYDDSDDFDGVALEALPCRVGKVIRVEYIRVSTRRMLWRRGRQHQDLGSTDPTFSP